MRMLMQHDCSNQKGMGLIDILVGIAILSGAIIGLLQLTTSNQKMALRSTITNDYARVVNNISALMINSSHCNANFRGLPAGTNLNLPTNAIRRCVAGTCHSSGTPEVLYPVVTTSWKLPETRIGNNIRLASARYTVNPVTARTFGALTLEVNIQTFDGSIIKDNYLKFGVHVVVDGSTIMGCPATWNTTWID